MVCFGEQNAVQLHCRLKSEAKRINHSSFPIYPFLRNLFAGCSFAFSTFALRHGRSGGRVWATNTGFTTTGSTRLTVDPAFTLIAAEPLPETITFCHFSCRQYRSFCTNFSAADHVTWSVYRCFGHCLFHLVVTDVRLWFLLCWHNPSLHYINRCVELTVVLASCFIRSKVKKCENDQKRPKCSKGLFWTKLWSLNMFSRLVSEQLL